MVIRFRHMPDFFAPAGGLVPARGADLVTAQQVAGIIAGTEG
jgi:hypothetical protein